jgi:hypothetical protein
MFVLQYKGKISPVCLAPKDGGLYENVPVTVTGWGTISSGGPQVFTSYQIGIRDFPTLSQNLETVSCYKIICNTVNLLMLWKEILIHFIYLHKTLHTFRDSGEYCTVYC